MRRTAKHDPIATWAALPLAAEEVWEGDISPLSAPLPRGHPQLLVALWVIAGDTLPVSMGTARPETAAADLLATMLQAMHDPAAGRPRRPGAVRVRDMEAFSLLEGALSPHGILVQKAESLPAWDRMFAIFDAATSPRLTGYRPWTKAHSADLAEMFQAAAEFYRAEPWRVLSGGPPLGVHVPDSLLLNPILIDVRGPVPILGCPGLLIFDSYEQMRSFCAALKHGRRDPTRPADLPHSLSLSFVSADLMPREGLAEAEKRGWEVAAADAYPLVLATEPGAGFVPDLSPLQLQVLTPALRAVTEFSRVAETDLRLAHRTLVRDVRIVVGGVAAVARVSRPPVLPGVPRHPRGLGRGPRRGG